MGGELLGAEGEDERNVGIKSSDDWDVCQDAQKIQGERNLVDVLSTTVGHYFPRFNEWLKGLRDPRDQEAIVYQKQTLIWSALLLLMTRRGSRKKLSDQMRGKGCCGNLKSLSGQEDLEAVPHGDTLEYLCRRLKEEDLEELQGKVNRRLLRARALERYRLLGKYYLIAIDGVHVHSFDYAHCGQCLSHEDAKGRRRWFHSKLEACLVTETGLCLPMGCEWIENEPNYVKQDCELRAFYRLLKKLRAYYPQLPMCVVLDSLYAAEPVFRALKEARMEWIVVFKEGSMSYIYSWVMGIKKHCAPENVIIETEEETIDQRQRRGHEERLTRTKAEHKQRILVKETTYSWMAGIEYSEDRHLFNIVTCQETKDGKKICDYVWLVSDGLNLNEDTVKPLAKAGRWRWKIENEVINTQKNGGYHLEHLYSKDEVSLKIWHRLLDLAYTLNQLIEKGSLIVLKTFGSIQNISQRMFEHLCYLTLSKTAQRPRIQIRLCWDTS